MGSEKMNIEVQKTKCWGAKENPPNGTCFGICKLPSSKFKLFISKYYIGACFNLYKRTGKLCFIFLILGLINILLLIFFSLINFNFYIFFI